MGQKANLLTIKPSFINLSLQTKYSKFFLYGNLFILTFKRLLLKKNINLTTYTINIVGNILFLNLTFFFKTVKIFSYKKKKFKIKNSKLLDTNLHTQFVKSLFKNLKLLRLNTIIFSIKNLNKNLKKKLSKKLLVFFYKKTKLYLNTLFQRRSSLFFDFLKQIIFLIYGFIDTKVFLQYLSQLFKYLHKKLHTRFFVFFNLITNLILNLHLYKKLLLKSEIKGIKLLIKGRLQGKMRANSKILQEGKIPSQTFDANVSIAKQHVCTLYGVYGLTLWVYRT